MKIIGILSGSGPEAGIAITDEMHKYLQEEYAAVDDLDYPDYFLYNKPLRGFGVTGIEHLDLVEQDFVNAMKKLDAIGVDIIGMACNTLHGLLSKVESDLDAKVINMIHETCKNTNEKDNILVLCSATTTKMGMYEMYLKENLGKKNVLTLSGEHQAITDDVIESVMGGTNGKNEIDAMNNIITHYKKTSPVDVLILGCTELPLAYNEGDCEDSDITVLSSNRVLAKTLVEEARKFKNDDFISGLVEGVSSKEN